MSIYEKDTLLFKLKWKVYWIPQDIYRFFLKVFTYVYTRPPASYLLTWEMIDRIYLKVNMWESIKHNLDSGKKREVEYYSTHRFPVERLYLCKILGYVLEKLPEIRIYEGNSRYSPTWYKSKYKV